MIRGRTKTVEALIEHSAGNAGREGERQGEEARGDRHKVTDIHI